MNVKVASAAAALIAVVIVAVVLLMGDHGGHDEAESSDGAFVAAMVPHHESAIEMAEIAQSRAEHPQVKALADQIIESQSAEIEELEAIHERLFEGPIGSTEHGSMGMDEHAMGMDGDTAMLETAKPFDRAFIDMMIPHHQGAIEMSQIELSEGSDEESMALAEEIIAAQSSEIEQMSSWREQWYGVPSPEGGSDVASAGHSSH